MTTHIVGRQWRVIWHGAMCQGKAKNWVDLTATRLRLMLHMCKQLFVQHTTLAMHTVWILLSY